MKGPCVSCGGNIEFPAELIGTSIDCPHCGKSTELQLAAPPQEPSVPLRLIVWTAVAALILALGVAGSLIALKRAQTLAARRAQASSLPSGLPADSEASSPAPTEPATAPTNASMADTNTVAQPSFQVSPIRLEKLPGTSLVYAQGRVTNPLERQRFGVRVELDLFDAEGQKVGTTKDYTQIMEPKADWEFKALVVPSKAVSARLATITEQQ